MISITTSREPPPPAGRARPASGKPKQQFAKALMKERDAIEANDSEVEALDGGVRH